jgi:hypothetical protein
MPLSTALPKLETDIEQLLTDLSTAENPQQARKDYSKRLAKAFYEFVQQGLVTTAGSATTQTGKIT